MIATLSNIARKLFWLRSIVLLLGLAFFVLFLYSLLSGNPGFQDFYLIPSILGVVWSLLFKALVSIFTNIPPKPLPDDKFFTRLKLKIKRGFLGLMAIVFLILTALVIFLTVRMLGIWQLEL